MIGFVRAAAVAACSFLLTACASDPDYSPSIDLGEPTVDSEAMHPYASREASMEEPEQPLQCVPFARALSGINLHGDASSWWDLAEGRYARSRDPQLGAVLVLAGYAGPHRGHVAVVTAIDSPRRIRVDHANWFGDGNIYRNDPVVDVSADNDWSEVRVWNIRTHTLGTRTYSARGFIGPGPDSEVRVASRY
ncbi:MAG: CHAP domain-containing protein [Alphaproteobacteria bacterium]|nr:CHAP domain-containing protein [Alphaproteobacteria bacterium]MBV9064116.1 CHAP domain-containing protein [Alphaproteobacteria bacterium]